MAVFLLSKKRMIEEYEKLLPLCDELSFSAKTNYDVAEQMGLLTNCSFNVHFMAELEKINDKSRIWFFPQGWDSNDVQKLLNEGVNKFVIDNEGDLKVLLSSIKGHSIDLMLRMRLRENTVTTGKFFVYGMRSDKVVSIIKGLRSKKFIRRLGIHSHRKSQNISEWNLRYELDKLLGEEIIKTIDLLDIGGGIPIRYKNFTGSQRRILKSIRDLKTWVNSLGTKLVIEPGRSIAGPAVKLVTTVKNVYDNNVVVDASVYNSAIDTFVVHHKLLVDGEMDAGADGAIPYTIKGYTPCSADIFRYRVYLLEVKKGDEIIFLNAGAYNFSSDFCSLPKIPTEVVD